MEFKSILDVENFIRSLTPKVLFRGHSYINWELRPAVGRNRPIEERDVLETFKKSILQKLSTISSQHSSKEFFKEFGVTDFALLALAQHYEIFATRFLDWSDNISVALFFACYDSSRDGCIWSFAVPRDDDQAWKIREKQDNPLLYEELKIYFVPRFIDEIRFQIEGKILGNRRPEMQRSIMTIHPKNHDGKYKKLDEIVNSSVLQKIIIPSSCKEGLLKELSEKYNINESTILSGKSVLDIKNEKILAEIMQINKTKLSNS